MKRLKKWIGLAAALSLALANIPVSVVGTASAASGELFSYEYEATGNSGAVITAASGYTVKTAEVDQADAAEVSVDGSRITVTAKEGAGSYGNRRCVHDPDRR